MTPNRRDLENRFDDLRGDDESDEELNEVERWRAWIESATDDDREDPADDE